MDGQLELTQVEAVTCATCNRAFRAGEPIFHFDNERYHVDCVPAEHASLAQSLLGVKSC